MVKVTTNVIQETPDKKFVIIDGICYSREAIESWTSDELAKLRNKLILKNQEASKDCAIYDAFEPYIKKAEIREERQSDRIELEWVIHETSDKKFVIIDNRGYPREVVDKWSSKDFEKLRDGMILRLQDEFCKRKDAIYGAFRPYIKKAEIREERQSDYIELEQVIRRMPREDVITLFAAYFNEFLNKKNGDGSKNE